MNQERKNAVQELHAYLEEGEAGPLSVIAERLQSQRPIPSAAFRASVSASLVELGARRTAWRPRRLRLAIGAYVTSGTALLAVAAVGLTGAGPLA